MKPKRIFSIFYAILLFLMLCFSVIAGYTGGGGYSGSTGSSSESGPGGYGFGEDDIDDAMALLYYAYGAQYLSMEVGFVCMHHDRNPDDDENIPMYPIVYFDANEKYGLLSEEDDEYGYATDFINDYSGDAYEAVYGAVYCTEDAVDGVSGDCLPYAFNLESSTAYDWVGGSIAIPTVQHEPSLEEYYNGDDRHDPRLYRYEGIPDDRNNPDENFVDFGCKYYMGMMHVFNIRDMSNDAIDDALNPDASVFDIFGYRDDASLFKLGITAGDLGVDGWLCDDDDCVLNIEWDEYEEQCKIIGGDWLGDKYSAYDYNYGDAMCCGDDSIWIRNIQVDYEENIEDNLFDVQQDWDDDLTDEEVAEEQFRYCLYGGSEDGGGMQPTAEGYSYRCSPAWNHLMGDGDGDYNEAYDKELDEDDDSLTLPIDRYEPYYFIDYNGLQEYETDEGKWSDSYELNPFYCYYSFTDETGDVYEWLNLTEAADRNPELCENLGGLWTGSHCCGVKYDYGTTYTSGEYFNESFSDTEYEFSYTDQEGYEMEWNDLQGHKSSASQNPACFLGQRMLNGETLTLNVSVNAEDIELELLNVNGTLYGCSLSAENITGLGIDYYTGADLVIDDDTNIEMCGIISGYADEYICGYGSDWYSSYEATEAMGYEDDTEAVLSEIPWENEDVQQSECCFANTCWNGTECLDELSEYIVEDNATGEELHYSCVAGIWEGPLNVSYDWYDYPNAEIFCPYPYSCVGSNEEGEYEYYSDGFDIYCSDETTYLDAGCTMVEHFFKNDHFCEFTSGQGQAEWTSRTKYVAMQLLEIAEDKGYTEYTLFCDNHVNSINDYVSIDQIPEMVNSFCVLHTGSETWMGVAINPEDDDDDPMNFDVEDVLFGTNGLVEVILDTGYDENDCEDALTEEDTEELGTYKECGDETTWFNNKTKSLIYDDDEFYNDYSDELPVFDLSAWNDLFEDKKDLVIDFAESDEDADDNYMYRIAEVDHFNKIYLKYDGTNYIFAFEEPKYDDISSIKHFFGVVYENQEIDCDTVEDIMEGVYFCDNENNNGIIIEKSSTGSQYWTDLTAELRIS